MNKGLKGLPPNFRKFFEGEFKRLLTSRPTAGTDPIDAIKDVMSKGVKAMSEDIKEEQKINEELESFTEDTPTIIKEGGSKEPIR